MFGPTQMMDLRRISAGGLFSAEFCKIPLTKLQMFKQQPHMHKVTVWADKETWEGDVSNTQMWLSIKTYSSTDKKEAMPRLLNASWMT